VWGFCLTGVQITGGCSMEWDNSYIVREPGIAWRILGDQAVLISPRDNMLYPLNTVGTRFWELADGSRTLQEAVTLLFEEFEVELQVLEADLREFVGHMQEKGLIRISHEAIAEEEKLKP
jgi:hypothetical protein